MFKTFTVKKLENRHMLMVRNEPIGGQSKVSDGSEPAGTSEWPRIRSKGELRFRCCTSHVSPSLIKCFHKHVCKPKAVTSQEKPSETIHQAFTKFKVKGQRRTTPGPGPCFEGRL